ncbi:YwdI family protein [Bacillus carboniphilus]|uniref:YwdI family protein n=1 Tax=Bacillus carboniphilus TaxID=86663 RepID=A0ABN0WK01_9BACI
MTISQQTVFTKMEDCLRQAKSSMDSRQAREHIRALHALCELLLDNQQEGEPVAQPLKESIHPSPSLQTVSTNTKKVVTEDGANGDSIFDF